LSLSYIPLGLGLGLGVFDKYLANHKYNKDFHTQRDVGHSSLRMLVDGVYVHKVSKAGIVTALRGSVRNNMVEAYCLPRTLECLETARNGGE